MKKTLLNLYKKNTLLLLVEMILIAINVYLLTVPSKLLGQIVDLLYNLDTNKGKIIHTVLLLLLMSLVLITVRVTWKMIDAKIGRDNTKKIRDTVYEKMLKTDAATIGKIKNGDIMSYFVKDINQVRDRKSVV